MQTNPLALWLEAKRLTLDLRSRVFFVLPKLSAIAAQR